jgi:3-demethoxyubiquinol 3-hydroxylase
MSTLDQWIVELDRGLRTLTGTARAARPNPADAVPEDALPAALRSQSAALMRVNHAGEVCAQALYQGQALGARNASLATTLREAADEELDHLDWTGRRVAELQGKTSRLNPLWYLGSLTMGYAMARAGAGWNLGFLRETERQVEAHLASHLERLPEQDERSRAIVAQMKADEAKHAATAQRLGARALPRLVQKGMRATGRLMTGLSYWL